MAENIEDATREAGEAIRTQLAARMIAEELGPLPAAARELAKELAGPKGWGHHIGGEGAPSMHRYTPEALLSLALHSREVRALERIGAALERAIPYLEKLTGCVCRLADCECNDASQISTSTPAPPPAGADTSSVKAPAGADAPAGANPSPSSTAKPSNG